MCLDYPPPSDTILAKIIPERFPHNKLCKIQYKNNHKTKKIGLVSLELLGQFVKTKNGIHHGEFSNCMKEKAIMSSLSNKK